MSRKHRYVIRVFQCSECHRKMYAGKGTGIKTSTGHIKTMFCPYCHTYKDFVQIDTK